MSDLPKRIRHWRTQAGMSQGELAKALGVHFSTVSHWERGASPPTAGNIQRVADACGVSMQIFWGQLPGGDDGAPA